MGVWPCRKKTAFEKIQAVLFPHLLVVLSGRGIGRNGPYVDQGDPSISLGIWAQKGSDWSWLSWQGTGSMCWASEQAHSLLFFVARWWGGALGLLDRLRVWASSVVFECGPAVRRTENSGMSAWGDRPTGKMGVGTENFSLCHLIQNQEDMEKPQELD